MKVIQSKLILKSGKVDFFLMTYGSNSVQLGDLRNVIDHSHIFNVVRVNCRFFK